MLLTEKAVTTTMTTMNQRVAAATEINFKMKKKKKLSLRLVLWFLLQRRFYLRQLSTNKVRKKISDLVFVAKLVRLAYYMIAMWHYSPELFLVCWHSYLLFGDFTYERRSGDVNEQVLATMMDPEFARFFPWQTAAQFNLLRTFHYASRNVHNSNIRWLDLWTLSFSDVWKNSTDAQHEASWSADRRFFLEKCTVAKWMVNGGKHCMVHIKLDPEDEFYDHIDVGFYCYPVEFAPEFLVQNTENHANYPWGSDGEKGWAAVCSNYHSHVSFKKVVLSTPVSSTLPTTVPVNK